MSEIDLDFLRKIFPNFKAWLETAEVVRFKGN
jgi:hypothetical protein